MIKDITYFLNRTKLDGECLIWTKCINTDGYARVVYNGNSNGKVHRIVYSLAHPDESIANKVVRHKCDNPLCINPNHLLSGTEWDNMRDRDLRGRHGQAKMTRGQVLRARELYKNDGFSIKQLADLYGVKYNTMQSLLTYRHWKSVV